MNNSVIRLLYNLLQNFPMKLGNVEP